MTRLIPYADPADDAELPDPWEAWLNGDIDLTDLPPEDQKRAREMLDSA